LITHKYLFRKNFNPQAASHSSSEHDGSILFRWEDNTGNGTAKANDKVILVAYVPAPKTAFFIIGAAMRKDSHAVLETTNMRGEIAETWIGFLSNDEEDAADSAYCGRVDL